MKAVEKKLEKQMEKTGVSSNAKNWKICCKKIYFILKWICKKIKFCNFWEVRKSSIGIIIAIIKKYYFANSIILITIMGILAIIRGNIRSF